MAKAESWDSYMAECEASSDPGRRMFSLSKRLEALVAYYPTDIAAPICLWQAFALALAKEDGDARAALKQCIASLIDGSNEAVEEQLKRERELQDA